MKRQNKKSLIYVLIAAGLLSGAVYTGLSMQRNAVKKAEEKRKKEELVNKLEENNKLLSGKKQHYDACHDFYSNAALENAKQNPENDNMDSLFIMCEQMDSIVQKNVDGFADQFIAKCKVATKRFANQKGEYKYFEGDGFFVPSNLYEWMALINTYANQIKNIKEIERDFQRLEDLQALAWRFDDFVNNEFTTYIYDDCYEPVKKYNKDSRILITDEKSVDVGGGLSLDGTGYRLIDDDVYEYNDVDNKKQNEIINALLQKYLYHFIVYGENQMPVMDNVLFNKIHRLALAIKQQNDLEAGVFSYEQASKQIADLIAANKSNIASLQR